MNEETICDLWTMFREYLDKKSLSIACEHFIDLLCDQGVSDATLKECLGADATLDNAINYYFEDDDEILDDDEEY
jgi:hypothetical protein